MNEQAESINMSRVLAILRDARQRLEDMEKRQHEPIAIVGMACRLPADIASPESFWSLLINGGTAVRAIPNERLNEAYFPSAGPDERQSSWRAGILEGVDRFDAEFFGISRREAVKHGSPAKATARSQLGGLERTLASVRIDSNISTREYT